MARRVAKASEFFDILSSMKGGTFATIGYVTGANLTYPQVKRKNPETNRMKSYDDFETFGKSMGEAGEVGGVIKLTSYTVNWSTPDSLAKAYSKYKADVNTIRGEFGLDPMQDRESYKSTQAYGDNGVSTYSGNNQDLSTHSYTAQNIHGARIKGMYYLVGVDGKIIRELTKDELKDYFKKSGEVSGVPALRKMGVEEERIKEYIDRIKALGMSYKNFEASSILYMVASVNGEKIVYINENLIQNVRGINIEPAEFTKIAKERYNIDFATIQECIAMSKNPINETIERVKRLF